MKWNNKNIFYIVTFEYPYFYFFIDENDKNAKKY